MLRLSKTVRTVFAVVALSTLGFGVLSTDAYAKRMGGGGGIGKTAPSYNRQAAPSNTTPPSAPAAAPSKTTNPAGTAAQPQQPQRNRFLGPLMGLAAGLGLAALFSHLGMGEGLANIMGMLLMAGIAVFLVRKLYVMLKSRSAPQRPAYAGASAGGYSQEPQAPSVDEVQQQPMSRDGLFGNGQSSNPRAMFDAMPAPVGRTGLVKELPAAFDETGFVGSAKKLFVTLQGLYDKGDVAGLREYCSDDVLEHLTTEIRARGTALNHTEILGLEAELLGFEVDVDAQLATVAFTGSLREQADAPANDLNEMWIMSRPVAGGGWILSGIHNL